MQLGADRVSRAVRVLLADDAPDIREMLGLSLRRFGIFDVVAEASNGVQAVELAVRERPDIAVLDIAMPAMDGLEAMREIRQRAPGTRIIAYSGYSADRIGDQARSAGADAYVAKSDDPRRVAEVMVELVGLSAADLQVRPLAPAEPAAAAPEQEIEIQHRLLLDALEEGVVVVDEHERVVTANFAATSILGVPTSRLIGSRVGDLPVERVGEDGEALAGSVFGDVLATGRPRSATLVGLRRGDGSLRWVLESVRALRWPAEERPHGAIASYLDVTERHRAEARFRGLLEAAPDAMLVVDPAGTVLLANAQAEQLFGYERDELVGRLVDMLVPGSRRAVHPDLRAGYVANPRTRPMGLGLDLTALRRDGSEFPAEISLSSIVIEGELVVCAAVRDVTERRADQQRLAQQAALLDLAHDAIIVREPVESRIVFWNREAAQTYGYDADAARGRITHELLATVFPISREAVEAELLESGRWEGDLRHTRRDGGVIIVRSRQALQRDADGTPIAIIEINTVRPD